MIINLTSTNKRPFYEEFKKILWTSLIIIIIYFVASSY